MTTRSLSKVSAFAPASIGNVSVGFDCLGLALERPGDVVSIEAGTGPGAQLLEVRGDAGKLPRETLQNAAGRVVQKILDVLGRDDALGIRLFKGMPLKSGLGSSAASSVAAALAANAFLGKPFSKKELLPFALEGEYLACGNRHMDNAAASLLGGIRLIRAGDEHGDIVALKYPEDLYCAVVHPDVDIATREARKVLPDRVSRDAAVAQSSHLAAFTCALQTGDWGLLSRSMRDFIAEPYRKKLLPHYETVKADALKAGALACGISGSGPSMFALCKGNEGAVTVSHAMQAACHAMELRCEVYVSAVNAQGAHILEK